MMQARFTGLILFAILTLIPLANAQGGQDIIEPASDEAVNPAASISFPPPVYVVSESVEIRGTVNLPNLQDFFIQYRELVLDETEAPPEEPPWLPATLRQTQPVTDGILGIWNTFIPPDGLYELRIAINPSSDSPEYVRVSPIRVQNDPPAFLQTAGEPEVEAAEAAETGSETVVIEVTVAPEEPEPTPTPEDTSPRVVAQVDSNVRAGDSTQYQRVGFLTTGQTAKIRGISSRGTGWYFIEMANGRTGFIFPGIVRAEGDLSNLERITPPPPPPPTPVPIIPTAVPQPPPQQQPAGTANISLENVAISPHPLVCQQTATITLTVRNNGPDSPGGTIQVRDTDADTNVLAGNTNIAFPALKQGASIRIGAGRLTVSTYFNELHNINFYIDNRLVHADAPYILQQGNC